MIHIWHITIAFSGSSTHVMIMRAPFVLVLIEKSALPVRTSDFGISTCLSANGSCKWCDKRCSSAINRVHGLNTISCTRASSRLCVVWREQKHAHVCVYFCILASQCCWGQTHLRVDRKTRRSEQQDGVAPARLPTG